MPTEADLHLGGQALMEGVMMRSERFYAAAVRRKDGSIQIIDEPIKPRWRRTKLMMIPPLRGLAVLLETMTLGIKLTRWSADAFMEDAGQQKTSNRGFAIELAISFAIVIGLFVALPHLIAGWGDTIDAFGRTAANLLEGGLRLSFFAIFLFSIGQLSDIRTLFAYHGAEHKVVHTVENRHPLTASAAKQFPRAHPRCGTAFVFLALMMTILVFACLPWDQWEWWQRIASRIVLLPIIAGFSYELIRFIARGRHGNLLMPLIIPGLWLQSLTTREPTTEQLEVAVAAMDRVLLREGNNNSHA